MGGWVGGCAEGAAWRGSGGQGSGEPDKGTHAPLRCSGAEGERNNPCKINQKDTDMKHPLAYPSV